MSGQAEADKGLNMVADKARRLDVDELLNKSCINLLAINLFISLQSSVGLILTVSFI